MTFNAKLWIRRPHWCKVRVLTTTPTNLTNQGTWMQSTFTSRSLQCCFWWQAAKDGVLTSDPKRIMKEVEVFYSSLHKRDNFKVSDVSYSFLRSQPIPKLSNDDTLACEGSLTLAECFKSLWSFQSNNFPGNDWRLTVEFSRKMLENFSWTVLIAHLRKVNYQALKNKQ